MADRNAPDHDTIKQPDSAIGIWHDANGFGWSIDVRKSIAPAFASQLRDMADILEHRPN